MKTSKLSLNELFIKNSLKNMTTIKNNPMPHGGRTFYIWMSSCGNVELRSILEKGNFWKVGHNSINSYIDLTDEAMDEFGSFLIDYGPNSNSSSRKIEFITFSDEPERLRICASGWGSSVVELYDGNIDIFVNYLKESQVR